VGEDRTERKTARYTVTQAADILGISQGAVRNRLSRGTLRSVKEGGTVYVLLSTDIPRDVKRDVADTPTGMSQSDATVLTSELRDRLRYVEEQLEAERQAHAEARRLLMAALERIPPQLEAPQETRESPETVEEEPERAEPRSGAAGSQEGAQRPWWRRWFGTE
jgi:predicted transcriptional regulator